MHRSPIDLDERIIGKIGPEVRGHHAADAVPVGEESVPRILRNAIPDVDHVPVEEIRGVALPFAKVEVARESAWNRLDLAQGVEQRPAAQPDPSDESHHRLGEVLRHQGDRPERLIPPAPVRGHRVSSIPTEEFVAAIAGQRDGD